MFYVVFSRAIAHHLAKLPDVVMVTGGSKGAPELLSHTFHHKSLSHNRESRVWHVLPERDSEVCLKIAKRVVI